MKQVDVVVRLVSPSIRINDVWEDFCQAVKFASHNLYLRYKIDILQVNKTYTGDALIKMSIPDNIETFNAGRQLKGISQYLLKHYPEKYKKLTQGTRLLQYAVIEDRKGCSL